MKRYRYLLITRFYVAIPLGWEILGEDGKYGYLLIGYNGNSTFCTNNCASCEKEKNKMFTNQEIDNQLYKAKSTIAHMAFFPALTTINKDF